MSDKVSDKWFKDHNFKKNVYTNTHEVGNYMGDVVKKKQVTYSIYFEDRWIRFDSYYQETKNKFGDKKISRYYMLFVYNKKTKFKVENTITHHLPTIEQMKAACLVCGIAI